MSDRSRTRRRAVALAVAATLAAASCSGGGDDATTTTTASSATTTTQAPASSGSTVTTAAPVGTLGTIELATAEVAVLDEPIALAVRPGIPDLYVAEREGRIRVIEVTPPTTERGAPRYRLQSSPVLDLRDEVITGGERGLLGIAFSTDGRRLYVDFTAEPDGRTIVREYQVDDRGRVDESSGRDLLELAQPFPNHNGGQLAVGADGYLYVGLGDGGGANDPDGNAQDTRDLLGKILRIDPYGAGPDGEPPYAIPVGNPFASGEGGAPEVWLYGVRNPWRFSFDLETGDLWIADVGQNQWEEIDRLPAVGGFDAGRGANLGWDHMEGTHPVDGENPRGAVLPVFEYSHDEGCSITGGYVYRGEAIPALVGTYLFADYCAPGIRGIQLDGDRVIDHRRWDIAPEGVVSFGQDDDGELYVLVQSGPVLALRAAGARGRG